MRILDSVSRAALTNPGPSCRRLHQGRILSAQLDVTKKAAALAQAAAIQKQPLEDGATSFMSFDAKTPVRYSPKHPALTGTKPTLISTINLLWKFVDCPYPFIRSKKSVHIVLIQRLGYEKPMQPKFETAVRTVDHP